MTSRRVLSTITSILGSILFILAFLMYFFFRDQPNAGILTLISFILSLLFSWAAVSILRNTEETGIIETLSWGIAILDSILAITLMLYFLLSANLSGLGS